MIAQEEIKFLKFQKRLAELKLKEKDTKRNSILIVDPIRHRPEKLSFESEFQEYISHDNHNEWLLFADEINFKVPRNYNVKTIISENILEWKKMKEKYIDRHEIKIKENALIIMNGIIDMIIKSIMKDKYCLLIKIVKTIKDYPNIKDKTLKHKDDNYYARKMLITLSYQYHINFNEMFNVNVPRMLKSTADEKLNEKIKKRNVLNDEILEFHKMLSAKQNIMQLTSFCRYKKCSWKELPREIKILKIKKFEDFNVDDPLEYLKQCEAKVTWSKNDFEIKKIEKKI